jgi:negative regulator of flagellin synthesis FlgM
MAIKISTSLQTVQVNKLSGKEKAETTKNSSTHNVAQGDSLKFTETAKELKQAFAALDSVPVINSDRVKQARDAISAGTYQVDAEKIAEQMVQFEKSLPETS